MSVRGRTSLDGHLALKLPKRALGATLVATAPGYGLVLDHLVLERGKNVPVKEIIFSGERGDLSVVGAMPEGSDPQVVSSRGRISFRTAQMLLPNRFDADPEELRLRNVQSGEWAVCWGRPEKCLQGSVFSATETKLALEGARE